MSCARPLFKSLCLFAALLVCGYFVFVCTKAGQAFDDAAYFGHLSVDRPALHYDGDILDVVSRRALVIVAGVLLGISLLRRRLLVGVLAVAGLGVAVVGSEFFKKDLPRHELAVPSGPVPAYFNGDTYPSGHTTIGTSVALALLLVLSARWRSRLAPLAGVMSASYATAVLFSGWHRPSDAVGGILWSGICLGLAGAAAAKLRKTTTPPGRVSRSSVIVLGLLTIAGIAIVCVATRSHGLGFADANLPFLVMTSLIIASALAMAGWFAWVLQSVET